MELVVILLILAIVAGALIVIMSNFLGNHGSAEDSETFILPVEEKPPRTG